jgi:hypothetical protein
MIGIFRPLPMWVFCRPRREGAIDAESWISEGEVASRCRSAHQVVQLEASVAKFRHNGVPFLGL